MIQFALVIALAVLGLVAAALVGRLEVTRAGTNSTLRRVEGALERAAAAVLRGALGRAALLLAVPGLGVLAFAEWGGSSGVVSAGGRAAFCLLTLTAGALSAFAQARLAVALGVRASVASAQGASRTKARALSPLVRVAAALSVFGEGLATLGVAAAFGGLYAVGGGFATAGGDAALARQTASLLPCFALGAAVMALALSREGSVFHAAAGVGASHAAEREAELDHDDPRSPAALVQLVGHHVGRLVPRASAAYVAGVSAAASAALVGALLSFTAPLAGGAPAPLAGVGMLLLARAFGVVASAASALAARGFESEHPTLALLRGQLAGSFVAIFGVGAAVWWLSRPRFFAVFGCALLGLACTSAVGFLGSWRVARARGVQRELAESRGLGEGGAIARGAGSGLAFLALTALPPALGLLACSSIVHAGALAELAALVGFAAGVLAAGPMAFGLLGAGLLADNAQGVATLARAEIEARRRGSRVDDAGAVGAAAAASQASVTSYASLGLGIGALLIGGGTEPGLGVSAAFAAGILGGAIVLGYAGRACRGALSAARDVAAEVERQLRGFAREQGAAQVPADYTPSYKACVEVAQRSSQSGWLLEAAALLASPFLLAELLKRLAANGAQAPRQQLLVFALTALSAALVLSLGSDAAQGTFSMLRRRTRGGEGPRSRDTTIAADSFGELLGSAAGRSAEALAAVLALTILTIAPLLG